jgi:hypothetical protein
MNCRRAIVLNRETNRGIRLGHFVDVGLVALSAVQCAMTRAKYDVTLRRNFWCQSPHDVIDHDLSESIAQREVRL